MGHSIRVKVITMTVIVSNQQLDEFKLHFGCGLFLYVMFVNFSTVHYSSIRIPCFFSSLNPLLFLPPTHLACSPVPYALCSLSIAFMLYHTSFASLSISSCISCLLVFFSSYHFTFLILLLHLHLLTYPFSGSPCLFTSLLFSCSLSCSLSLRSQCHQSRPFIRQTSQHPINSRLLP